MKDKIKVVGLLIEKHVETDTYDFGEEKDERETYTLMLQSGYTKFELTLRESYGMCPSGWTTASWGICDIVAVSNFRPFSHVPIKEIILDDDIIEYNEDYRMYEINEVMGGIHTDVFDYSYDGGDGWYPNGYVSVNMELFKESKRFFEKRPVWIFNGDSGLGKSTIGTFLTRVHSGMTVFETDSVDELPDGIVEDVIILGNRSGFSIEDVKEHLFGKPEVILVNFSLSKADDTDNDIDMWQMIGYNAVLDAFKITI